MAENSTILYKLDSSVSKNKTLPNGNYEYVAILHALFS